MRVNDNDIEYSSEIVDTKEEVYEVVKEQIRLLLMKLAIV